MSATASYPNYLHNVDMSGGSGAIESAFDSRLQDLRFVLDELHSTEISPSPVASRAFHEAVQILSQNAEMIRWKMRVAKHCSRSVRDVIWRNVRNSIADLENKTDVLEQQVREVIPGTGRSPRPFSENGETLATHH